MRTNAPVRNTSTNSIHKEDRQFCLTTPDHLKYPSPTDRMVQVADANNEQSATTKEIQRLYEMKITYACNGYGVVVLELSHNLGSLLRGYLCVIRMSVIFSVSIN